MKEKQYVVSANAYCKEGKEHHVTIVGVYKRIKEKGVEVIDEVDEAGVEISKIKKVKRYKRTFTMSYSICHPEDEYNEKIGIHIAMRRLKNGDTIGTLATSDLTMLNDDQCYAILTNEKIHITKNIDHYIKKKTK